MTRAGILALLTGFFRLLLAQEAALVPLIDGEWWTIASDPDVHPFTTPDQQPVDFAIWQAADGSWQLWSCIRKTSIPGRTRLFHRWEGREITSRDWTPMGIAMTADPGFGETPGGLQAPFVFRHEGLYRMFYGDWVSICQATGYDGKTFARLLGRDGRAGMFGEGAESNARDPMVIRAGRRWHLYYTAHPNRRGAVYCRTSRDLRSWGPPRIVASGGSAGDEFTSAECPFVFHHRESGWFYLFRTQRYGERAQTNVYRSRDPLDFGAGDDRCLVASLPVAAPEIVEHAGGLYIASLLPSLKGIRLARLSWVPKR
jgi:hypothetical protein